MDALAWPEGEVMIPRASVSSENDLILIGFSPGEFSSVFVSGENVTLGFALSGDL